MGMSLKAYDRQCSPPTLCQSARLTNKLAYANTALASAADVTLVDSLAALLPVSDFLTIHTPLIASTKGMIGAPELARMKPTARILNVARGGMIDEAALLAALEAGALAGAGIDVFTAEPPVPGDTASALIAHPRVVATPHLGASTREAQENVSVDVCEQVALILGGQLPRSAVNAVRLPRSCLLSWILSLHSLTVICLLACLQPIILPEEYRTLQPFVGLIEKMGSLYTQHYSSGRTLRGGAPASASASVSASTFELSYEGQLAGLGSTKPLFAGLVKGLLAPILSASVNINVVNAELVARERGILVNEQRSRETRAEGYSSYVTLRVRRRRRSSAATPSSSPSMKRAAPAAAAAAMAAPPGPGKQGAAAGVGAAEPDDEERVIAGFVAGNIPYISRLGRFHTRFVPAGNLLICRNYDEPGKIGKVGGILGANGVNIESMTVAPPRMMQGEGEDEDGDEGRSGARRAGGGSGEALMILGVDRPVSKDVIDVLVAEQGVTEASVVAL